MHIAGANEGSCQNRLWKVSFKVRREGIGTYLLQEVRDMILPITIEIIKKGKWYIAKAVELDFVSQGRTLEEAKKNLLEVTEIQFEEMKKLGTLNEYLEECGYKVENTDQKYPELISVEKSKVYVECL